jgi:hypothetical protein
MKPSVIVWDLETVSDISGFAAAKITEDAGKPAGNPVAWA